MIVILFRDYFATPKQKDILNNLLKQNQQKTDKEKYEKYNPNDIFKNRKDEIITNNQVAILPVTIKKEKWHIQILDFFSGIFKK